jgi:protein SERAC1
MSSEFIFEKISACESPLVDVIFIHGLTGDARKTWECPRDGNFWPEWLQEDLKHLAIYTLGYPASVFEKWSKKEMDMFERANNVLEMLSARGFGDRPIALVTHSMGGLLAKILIRKSCESPEDDYRKIAQAIKLVVFVATPHTGSSVANVVSLLPRSGSHVSLLANDTGYLQDLNESYRAHAGGRLDLATKVYYEKYETKKALIVARESADPGIVAVTPIAVDKDHINICKPESRDDIVYLGIRRALEKIVDGAKIAHRDFLDTDYSGRSLVDRRDLHEKLADANREHEYAYANDAQGAFARSYLKTGLFTPAREQHENLLSEVETRFTAHVFHPLICRNAAEEDVRNSIQRYVIDAVSSQIIGGKKYSAKAVWSALYYLTEQCHIRWDPA